MSILKQIKPCDREKPYIFISYSSHDSTRVWEDVLEYQRRGYNVWLDERNLDKTNSSWKDDALVAIEDMYCYLVVFYVSAASMTSESCYNEMKHTTSDITVAHHFFDPLKYIAVEVDPIDNMTEFARGVFNTIRGDYTMPKDEKQRKSEIITYFIRDFFNTNNEKVRVHPKNEPNRKMDYYDEITASFPDEARIFETESKEIAVEAPPVSKAKIKHDENAGDSAQSIPQVLEKRDNEIQQIAEKPTKIDASDEALEDNTPPSDINVPIPVDIVFGAYEKFWSNDISAFSYSKLTEKQKSNIDKYFFDPDNFSDAPSVTDGDDDEFIVAVYSTALFTFAKEGYLLTNKYFYTNIIGKFARISLSEVTRVEMKGDNLRAYSGRVKLCDVYVNSMRQKCVIPLLEYIITERDAKYGRKIIPTDDGARLSEAVTSGVVEAWNKDEISNYITINYKNLQDDEKSKLDRYFCPNRTDSEMPYAFYCDALQSVICEKGILLTNRALYAREDNGTVRIDLIDVCGCESIGDMLKISYNNAPSQAVKLSPQCRRAVAMAVMLTIQLRKNVQ